MVKNPPCNAGVKGLIPGRGTKIPHAIEQLRPAHHYGGACAPQWKISQAATKTQGNLNTKKKKRRRKKNEKKEKRNLNLGWYKRGHFFPSLPFMTEGGPFLAIPISVTLSLNGHPPEKLFLNNLLTRPSGCLLDYNRLQLINKCPQWSGGRYKNKPQAVSKQFRKE